MISGVWLSPDGEKVAIQVYEEEIFVVEAAWIDKRPEPVDEVPADWRTLYDTTDTAGSTS